MGRFILNLIATILVVAVNTLANTLPINGQSTGSISSKIHVIFTPAGYVFGIWGLIYVLLFIWVLRQFPSTRRDLPVYIKATPLYLLSCILNISWIFLWHYEYFLLTVLIMIGLLLTLTVLYHRIRKESTAFWDITPFSVYLGWISVATIANISYVLVYMNWDRFVHSDFTWTIAMLIIATGLAIAHAIQNKDPIFAFVFVWAFIGIGVKNASSHPTISYIAYGLAAIIFFVSLMYKKISKAGT